MTAEIEKAPRLLKIFLEKIKIYWIGPNKH